MSKTVKSLGALAAVAIAIQLVLALVIAPPDARQGDAQRLMYVHVPAAWLAYLAFFVTALASALYLWPRTRRRSFDLLAGASAEVGVMFTGLALILGSIWGKPIWGVWWQWDARLTTTAVLFFLYVGYLALRRIGAPSHTRSKRCAIAALIAFIDVPIVHQSVEWWETLHQKATVFDRRLGEANITGTMSWTLLFSVLAFTILYAFLTTARRELLELEEGLEERELSAAIEQRVGADVGRLDTGAAVTG